MTTQRGLPSELQKTVKRKAMVRGRVASGLQKSMSEEEEEEKNSTVVVVVPYRSSPQQTGN